MDRGTVVNRIMPSNDKILPVKAPPGETEELPYLVELWHEKGGDKVERILGRAVNAQLARAIFKAAMDEHPNRRITLRSANRVIADSLRGKR